MALLLLAFIVVPLVELFVIGQVAGWLGLGTTVLVLFLDSLAGAVLVRREGRRAWDALRRALAEMRWPGDEVMQGALVLIGGALLVTPGFVTDVAGLVMVAPVTRAAIARTVRARMSPSSFGALAGRPGGTGADPGRRVPPRRGSAGRGGDDATVLEVEVLSVEREEHDGEAP